MAQLSRRNARRAPVLAPFFLVCTQAVCCLTWIVVVFGADMVTAGIVETAGFLLLEFATAGRDLSFLGLFLVLYGL